jgi:hypothetical protein
MPINCLTTGRSVWKSLEQNVTLGSMIFLFLLLIISPILGIATYNSGKNFDNDLCNQYGIDRLENDNEFSVMTLSVLAIVCFLLSGLSFYYHYNQNVNNLGLITPLLILFIAIIASISAGLLSYSDDAVGDDNLNVDSKIRNWCYTNNDTAKALNVTMVVFMSINISIFVGWLTSIIASSCEIY